MPDSSARSRHVPGMTVADNCVDNTTRRPTSSRWNTQNEEAEIDETAWSADDSSHAHKPISLELGFSLLHEAGQNSLPINAKMGI